MEQLDLRRDETSVLAVIYFPNHPERIAALLKPLHNQLQADEPKLGDHTDAVNITTKGSIFIFENVRKIHKKYHLFTKTLRRKAALTATGTNL